MGATRVLILGAAGRDFHNFNVLFRSEPGYHVVGFTAQQIPHIGDRQYPASLAGPLYPAGLPIFPEERLEGLIRERGVDEVVLSYSDLSHQAVMHLASRAGAAGADFRIVAAGRTMLPSRRPVVAVCASRTGAGKSPTTRAVVRLLRGEGLRVAVIRHPMPYGDLQQQRVQRFQDGADLERHRVTVEEREEYEPHLAAGSVVFAGVDYGEVLAAAEAESDVVVWDGGNNDTPFVRPDVYVTVVDPHRPGHELSYHPGETNLRLATVVVISKVDTAHPDAIRRVRENVAAVNPHALIVEAALPITLDDPEMVRGRRVLAIEDGPTVTHGEMAYGAAAIAAREAGAADLVDPRPFATGEIAETFSRYPAIGPLLPAMGYGPRQVRDLEATLARAAAGGVEAVVVGTPADLGKLVRIPVPHTRARYEMAVAGASTLHKALSPILAKVAVPA